MNLKIEIVSDRLRFIEIRDNWQNLWCRSNGFIFQSHAWLTGWLEGMHDRKEARLLIAVVWDGDLLRGAMPCAVHRRSGLKVLTWAAQLFSDYCDCLIEPGYESTLPTMWDALRQNGGFDLISLQQIRPDATCRVFLDRLAVDGGQLQFGDRAERCMRIEKRWDSGDNFFRSLNKKGRNNHTRGKRILTELGGQVDFDVVEALATPGPVIDEILHLKQLWLQEHDPQSPLLGADRLVLRAILVSACQSGLAKVFLLHCGGRIAAASVNFVYADRMEAYFTAYDPAFERASPGTILIVEYTMWAFDRGLSRVDFLRGEEAFKFRMANAETLLNSFSGARTLMGQLAVSGHRWLTRRRQRQELIHTPPSDELEAVG